MALALRCAPARQSVRATGRRRSAVAIAEPLPAGDAARSASGASAAANHEARKLRLGSLHAARGSATAEAATPLRTLRPRVEKAAPRNNVIPTGRAPPAMGAANGNGAGRKLRVAVDVDEVLARFLLALNNFCAEKHDMRYEVEDYSVYDFKTIWECSQEESNELVHAFFESTHFHEGVPVIPGALSSLQRMGDFCDLMVVTSRQHVIQQPTLDWLDDNFPEVFGEVHFGNHYALEGESRKKSEICAAIGAQVLIDDNPGYALDCAEAGMQVLLFDWHLNYPWAKTEGNGPSHPNITRVADWAAVETVLGVLARSEAPGVESAEPVHG